MQNEDQKSGGVDDETIKRAMDNIQKEMEREAKKSRNKSKSKSED